MLEILYISETVPSQAEFEKRLVAIFNENKQAKARLEKLAALEAAGVDNWDGYDEAMESLST